MDNLHKVPKELTDSDQWILWKAVQRDGKTTKVPCRADGTPTPVNDPASWLSFADACAQAEEHDHIAGIGFCFTEGDPFVGIDLDDCLPLTPQAKLILASIATYAEVSPSGTGIKLIGRGVRPDGFKNRTKDVDFGQIEVYDRDRFFTITGATYDSMHDCIEDIQSELDWLHAAFLGQDRTESGTVRPVEGASSLLEQAGGFEASDDELIFFLCQDDKYARLWNGDFSDYGERGESEADLALVEKIAWLAGPYPERIERIMNASALARPKWFEREDYRRMTIDKALAGKGPGDFYSGGGGGHRLEAEDYSSPAESEDLELDGEKLTAFPIPERGIIRDVVDLVGPLTESPDSTLALGTLIMLSAIAGWGRVAKWGESEEPCILYASIVGPSASGRKTTGLRTVEAIFREVFSDDELRLETGGHISGRGLIESAIGGVDIFYVKVKEPVGVPQTLELEDGSTVPHPEWVEYDELMAARQAKLDNPPAVVLIWDEMAKLLSVEGDWQRDTRAELLRMYNGHHGGIRTSGREGLKVPKGRVQMGFLGTMVTDDLRRGLNSAQANDGLMGRILFSPDGDGKPPLAFPPEPPSDYEIRKQHLARKLMRFRERCETRQTVFASWTHEARKCREEWYMERKRGSGLELMLFDRVQATAAKIACLLALADDSDLIEVDHVRLAQQMADTSIAVSVGAVEAAVESQRDRYLDALEERITRDGPIPMSVLLRDSGMLGVKEPGEKMPERELRKLWVEKDPRLTIEDGRGGRRVRLA